MTTRRNTTSLRAMPKPKAAGQLDLDPTPRLLTPPELIGREDEHVVVRNDDDTDESYASRCKLVALILGTAPKS